MESWVQSGIGVYMYEHIQWNVNAQEATCWIPKYAFDKMNSWTISVWKTNMWGKEHTRVTSTTPNCLDDVLPSTPSLTASITSSAASTSTQPTPEGIRPRPGGRIHQWAQTANTLGRRLGVQTVTKIQEDRRERYEAAERQIANKYDEAKVVTILLWLNPDKPKVISAHFDQWPKARLDESSLLMQACTQALGPTWNRALLFWNDKIDAWHETMVTFPHRYPADVKVVVVRSQLVDPRIPGLPQPKAKLTPVGLKPLEEAAPSAAESGQHPTSMASRATSTATPPESDDEVVVVKSYMRIGANGANEPASSPAFDEIEVVKSNSLTIRDMQPAKREDSEELPIFNLFDKSPIREAGHAVNGGCCHVHSLFSGIDKRQSIEDKVAGIVGTCFDTACVVQGMYRAWIGKVDYDRFRRQYRHNPLATVGEARILYKKEFQAVANGAK
ncbi:uncharacterized protein MELLADRAFT_105950 [Melampsora larici-populina 98AG31]|uniref:Uncharacterized protein n=1 Tax=Melampsora larici-populina (strain 98AG31 / pathotype 3-4-7) TaxID=747676 RepID=F4RJV9_MELLP|nr:uncharacterized protein MELLADRAFT_105950 [Melampsora larici-populina 98AG31]EGG07381.1 hypothetical protein MELLADRAFT_105950 [Melampsora larici-populina 98AG31]